MPRQAAHLVQEPARMDQVLTRQQAELVASERRLVLQVGHLERFNSTILMNAISLF